MKIKMIGGKLYVVDESGNQVGGPFNSTAEANTFIASGGTQTPSGSSTGQPTVGGTSAVTNVGGQNNVPEAAGVGGQGPQTGRDLLPPSLKEAFDMFTQLQGAAQNGGGQQQPSAAPATANPASTLPADIQAGIQNGSLVFYPPGHPRAEGFPQGRVVTAQNAAFMDLQETAGPGYNVQPGAGNGDYVDVFTEAPVLPEGATPAPWNAQQWQAEHQGRQFAFNPQTGQYETSNNQIAIDAMNAAREYQQQAAAHNMAMDGRSSRTTPGDPTTREMTEEERIRAQNSLQGIPTYDRGGKFRTQNPTVAVDVLTGEPVAMMSANGRPEIVEVKRADQQFLYNEGKPPSTRRGDDRIKDRAQTSTGMLGGGFGDPMGGLHRFSGGATTTGGLQPAATRTQIGPYPGRMSPYQLQMYIQRILGGVPPVRAA